MLVTFTGSAKSLGAACQSVASRDLDHALARCHQHRRSSHAKSVLASCAALLLGWKSTIANRGMEMGQQALSNANDEPILNRSLSPCIGTGLEGKGSLSAHCAAEFVLCALQSAPR